MSYRSHLGTRTGYQYLSIRENSSKPGSTLPLLVFLSFLLSRSTKSYYYGSSKTSTYGTVFGLPIIITVPRKGCTYSSLYDIIVTQCRYAL